MGSRLIIFGLRCGLAIETGCIIFCVKFINCEGVHSG